MDHSYKGGLAGDVCALGWCARAHLCACLRGGGACTEEGGCSTAGRGGLVAWPHAHAGLRPSLPPPPSLTHTDWARLPPYSHAPGLRPHSAQELWIR